MQLFGEGGIDNPLPTPFKNTDSTEASVKLCRLIRTRKFAGKVRTDETPSAEQRDSEGTRGEDRTHGSIRSYQDCQEVLSGTGNSGFVTRSR